MTRAAPISLPEASVDLPDRLASAGPGDDDVTPIGDPDEDEGGSDDDDEDDYDDDDESDTIWVGRAAAPFR